MRKFYRIFIMITFVLSWIFIIFILTGYRLVIVDYNIDISTLSIVIQILMTIATFSAVIVAIIPSRTSMVMHFYMKYNNFVDLSMKNSRPKLFITNPSNRIKILHKIAIYKEKTELVYIDLLSDDVCRPQIETVNKQNFLKVQPIIINPNETYEIVFSISALEYNFGHVYDGPTKNDGYKKIRIEITDMNGKKNILNTDVTFEEYYDNIMNVIKDEFE